jgi:type II secretory ATPase GspE/PulE/Tfp pilus assembly ATPase PilB-like protein
MNEESTRFEGPRVADLMPEAAVTALIDHAAQVAASDLFFATNENHVGVALRHLGLVRRLTTLPLEMGRKCLSHIKVMAGMDVAERRRPLDGRWIRQTGAGRIDIRINTIPTLYGEDFNLRLLQRDSQLLAIGQLGLPRRDFNELQGALASPSGMLLVTGPTGSGKTTTLYACLNSLNNGARKINTIEDPIEYSIDGVRQSQVNLKLQVDFPDLLRNVLRQTPDVIMIGEIRDGVTAATAVHAANSGHLVLATLHAPTAAGAIQSMVSLGVHPHFLASSLLGVIAQRLVRTLCPQCKMPFDLTDAPPMFDEIKRWLEPGQGQVLYAAKGCKECHGTGYAARTGVFELLRVTRALRQLIVEGRPARDIRQKAIEEGLIELRQSALLKVAQGLTNAEEVVRAVPSEYLGLED